MNKRGVSDKLLIYIVSRLSRLGHEKVPLRVSKEGASYFVGGDREVPMFGRDADGKMTTTGRKKIFSRSAKMTFIKSRNIWKLYWPRASGRWDLYGEYAGLDEVVRMIDEDPDHCFWG